MPRKSDRTKKSTPKHARRKQVLNLESDSSSQEDSDTNRPSTSSQALSQSRNQKQNRISTQMQNISLAQNTVDIKSLVTNTVKYLLNFSTTKIPIKRADICRNVNITAKVFPEVFTSSVAVLKHVYGLEVSEVMEGKTAKVFIIHSNFSSAITALQLPTEHRHEISLLFLILSYIFMKGGEIQEAHLIQFLNQLDIDTNEPHKVFGDVPKLIREKFTRQLYLKRSKVEIEGVNEVQIHLTWGARAEKEFDKKEVLKTVAGIMNKSPITFINQFHETTKEDEEVEEMIID